MEKKLVKLDCGLQDRVQIEQKIELKRSVFDNLISKVDEDLPSYKGLINNWHLYNIESDDIEDLPQKVDLMKNKDARKKIGEGSTYLEVLPKGYETTQLDMDQMTRLANSLGKSVSYIKIDSTNGKYLPRGFLIKPTKNKETLYNIFSGNVSLISVKIV